MNGRFGSFVSDGVVLSRQWVLKRLVENVNRAMQKVEVIGAAAL